MRNAEVPEQDRLEELWFAGGGRAANGVGRLPVVNVPGQRRIEASFGIVDSQPKPERGSLWPVDPLEPDMEYRLLDDVVKPVVERSTAPTAEVPCPPYNAIVVHEDPKRRQALLDHLLELFEASLGFRPEQAKEVTDALRTAMPHPVNDAENFRRFVQGRCHGVLEMLKQLVVLRNTAPAGRRVETVICAAREIGAGHSVEGDGGPSPINMFIAEVYNAVMCVRVSRVKFLIEAEKLKGHNASLQPRVHAKYEQAGLSAVLSGIVNAYADNIDEFALVANPTTPEYPTAQWYNNLLRALYNLDLSDATEVHTTFEELYQGLQSAGDARTFAGVIDNLSDLAKRQVAGRQAEMERRKKDMVQIEFDFTVTPPETREEAERDKKVA